MNGVTLVSSTPSSMIPDLITSTTSGILGPIQTSDSVYIGTVFNVGGRELQPFFVGKETCTAAQRMSQLIRFDALVAPSGDINTYRIGGEVDENNEPRIFLVNTRTNAPLGFIQSGGKRILAELAEGSIPPMFRLQQSTYSPWPIREAIALSFINYNLVPEGGGELFVCMGDQCSSPSGCESDGLLQPLPSIFFAPETWFANCESGKDTVITSRTTTLCSVFCAGQSLQTGPKGRGACGKPSGGVCAGQPLLGFTNRTDCTNKFRYEYCTVPKQCEGTCRSGCPSVAQVCTFQSRSNGGGVYHCIGATGPNGPTGPTGTHCIIDLQCNPPQRCIDRRCQTPLLSKTEEEILIVVAIVVGVIVGGVILFGLFLLIKGETAKKK